MSELFISVIGILFADRILYRLEKFSYLQSKYRNHFLIMIFLIFFILLVFKELKVLSYVLFGIFFLSLMFFYVIHEKKMLRAFENREKSLLDELILQIKAGVSPSMAYERIFYSMNADEKRVFGILELHQTENKRESSSIGVHRYEKIADVANLQAQKMSIGGAYLCELRNILSLKSKVIDQLESFRENIKLKIKLRRKSRTVTQSTRMQAIVAIFIYLIFVSISWNFLNLAAHLFTAFASLVVFVTGEVLVFRMGKNVKWTI